VRDGRSGEVAAFLATRACSLVFQAECQFIVRGVVDSFQRYCLVVLVLPHESLRLVADIVEAPPATGDGAIPGIDRQAVGVTQAHRLPEG
jgi:hypothetical protein